MSARNVRKVELQLLRHGPPHNQLLSPLTDYLALCGDHPNTTLNFPLEHESLRVRLRALRYEDSDETRRAQLSETAHIAADVLATVPGLISDLGRYQDKDDACVQLSIATSAAELALFPFELANSPPGFPGSGGSLCLQSQSPVCLTRRSRNVCCEDVNWNLRPTVLVIASDAGGAIPLEQHYALLRKLLEPWVKRVPTKDNPGKSLFHERIEVISDATVQTIKQKMDERVDKGDQFTHIHILAHGCPLPGSKERFGVALHNPKGSGIDAVSGARLGRLLTTPTSNGVVTRPNVVTLAVCDSVNQGDVSVPGASMAFELHEADIPLVVGSQFPLTKGGSTILTETLYSEILQGTDPREAIWETRRTLFTRNAEKIQSAHRGRHDWGSMVAFAAFPNNIARAAKKLEYRMRRWRMDISLEEGDRLVDELFANAENLEAEFKDHVRIRMDKIGSEVRDFNRWLDSQSTRRNAQPRFEPCLPLSGICASANKRLAELLYLYDKINGDSNSHESNYKSFIRRSQRLYAEIAGDDFNQAWAHVQNLFLTIFLKFDDPERTDDLENAWKQTNCLCQLKEQSSRESDKERSWHVTNMIELGLLLHLLAGRQAANLDPEELNFGNQQIKLWCDELDYLGTKNGMEFTVYSGRRQLCRYGPFADMLLDSKYDGLASVFKEIYDPLEEHVGKMMKIDSNVRNASL